MLKKALLLTISYYLLVIVLQSCCNEQYAINGMGGINVYDAEDNWVAPEDTLRGEFRLSVRYSLTQIAAAGFVPITKAFASFDCMPNAVNAVEADRLIVELDRNITTANGIVSAGDNLMAMEEIADLIENTVWNNPRYAEHELVFSQELIDQISPLSGSLTISMTSYTSDEREMEGSVTVLVDF